VITQQLLGLQAPLIVNIALHLGTLSSALVFFRKDIISILATIPRMDLKSTESQYLRYIILGNIPIVSIGLFTYDAISSTFNNTSIVSICLLITGVLLYISKYAKRNNQLNAVNCLLIGLAQAVALLPGISRSGITIATGRLRGVKDEIAFKFSFLLSIPAIIAANLFEFFKLNRMENVNAQIIMIGVIITAFVGYLSLKFLYESLKKGKFHLFAFYCWGLGIVLFFTYIVL
jgi:undecaprenyl-diphosphatase